MFKAIKKAVRWYLDTTANSIYFTPSCMIPVYYGDNKKESK